MLALGFASKPLYDTFCKITGYGGTTRYAEENLSEILDRKVTVNFDSNVKDLPWDFAPEQRKMTVQLGQSGLAYYKAKKPLKPTYRWYGNILSDVSAHGTDLGLG